MHVQRWLAQARLVVLQLALLMKQFFNSRGPSSLSSAEQVPVPGSAVQLALQLASIADLRRWLDTDCISARSAEVHRLREAVDILRRPKPDKDDIRFLQSPSNWNVPQQKARKPRPIPDVIEDLKCKVLKAARKVQKQSTDGRLNASGSAEQPVLAGSSTDRGNVQNDLAAGTADLGGEARLKYRLKGQCRLAKKGQCRLVKKRG